MCVCGALCELCEGSSVPHHVRHPSPFLPSAVFHHWWTSGCVLLVGWLAHYVPYFLLSRVLFLHHYLPAIPFKLMLLAAVCEHLYVWLKRWAQRVLASYPGSLPIISTQIERESPGTCVAECALGIEFLIIIDAMSTHVGCLAPCSSSTTFLCLFSFSPLSSLSSFLPRSPTATRASLGTRLNGGSGSLHGTYCTDELGSNYGQFSFGYLYIVCIENLSLKMYDVGMALW